MLKPWVPVAVTAWVIVVVPPLFLELFVLGEGGGGWIWRHTDGRPVLRFLTVATVAAGGALLAYAWISPRNYTPIKPGERGTLIQSVRAVKSPSDLPKDEAPEPAKPEPEASTTTTTEPAPTTTVASRRSGTPTTVAEGNTTTTVRTTTTEPSPTTTQASPTTTAP